MTLVIARRHRTENPLYLLLLFAGLVAEEFTFMFLAFVAEETVEDHQLELEPWLFNVVP